MPRTCRPIYMPELAKLLWGDHYDLDDPHSRHLGCERARTFLRRIERDRGKQLIFKTSGRGRCYTTEQLLKRYASEIFDLKGNLEAQITTALERGKDDLIAVKKAQMGQARRQVEIAKRVGEIAKDLKALEKRLLALLDEAD
jgi:hypothetical protein